MDPMPFTRFKRITFGVVAVCVVANAYLTFVARHAVAVARRGLDVSQVCVGELQATRSQVERCVDVLERAEGQFDRLADDCGVPQ
jgi:hypothetical protein